MHNDGKYVQEEGVTERGRKSDKEEAVGSQAGAGLQPSNTSPHTPASRVSHCLPLERMPPAGKRQRKCWAVFARYCFEPQ